jgi:Ca2+-binding RTX toxin-like protein
MRLLGAVLLSLLLAAPASAATVTAKVERVAFDRYDERPVLKVSFLASAGEANRVTVTGDLATVRIRDDAAPLALSGPCERVDDFEVVCRYSIVMATVDTADADDRVEAEVSGVALGPGDDVASGRAHLRGGPGNDRLDGISLNGDEGADVLTVTAKGRASGGADDDTLTGSPEADGLTGGPGADTVLGGDGDDTLYDGEKEPDLAPDLHDGGGGFDRVEYTARTAALTLDLNRGASGAAGEGDRLAGLEAAYGGGGNDSMIGDDAPNLFDGYGGADTLDGRGGADRLQGSIGGDRVSGGDGGDVIDAGEGYDSVDGGAGDDAVHGGPGIDTLDGGEGADRLVTSHDWLRDTARCGGADDEVRADVGDAVTGDCERVARSKPFSLLMGDGPRWGWWTLTVARYGSVDVGIDCDWEHNDNCRATVELRVRGRTVARGRFGFCRDNPDPECVSGAESVVLRLPAKLRRRVWRSRRVRAQTVIALGPGIGRGGLPVKENVWLVPGRAYLG